jgi:hypothetical protein
MGIGKGRAKTGVLSEPAGVKRAEEKVLAL